MQAAPHASGLLQLPPEALHNIWQLLKKRNDPANRGDALALRCTCKQLREVTATFISSLRISRNDPMVNACINTPTALTSYLAAQLAAFPARACLKTLEVRDTWHTWACKPGDPGPAVVRSFIHQGRHRLSSLTRLSICHFNDLTCNDFIAIADTCIDLRQLSLMHLSTSGAVYTPLAKLRSLSHLYLQDVRDTLDKPAALVSLQGLTGLTSLTIKAGYGMGTKPETTMCDAGVLPWLSRLHGLRDLHLSIINAPPGSNEEIVPHISTLQHLTSLTLEGIDLRLPPQPPSSTTCQLACPSKLARLTVMGTSVAADIRLYASLPLLSELRMQEIDLDTDLSRLPCRWQKLIIDSWPSPCQLASLPQGPGMKLDMPSGPQWEFSNDDGLGPAKAALARAVAWLALTDCLLRNLKLDWDRRPWFPCSELLAVLAPLGGRLASLIFANNWPLHVEDVRQGAQHLPALKRLTIAVDDCGYEGFLDAMAGVAWLDHLTVYWRDDDDTTDEEDEAALRCRVENLVLRRASTGHCLRVATEELYVP